MSHPRARTGTRILGWSLALLAIALFCSLGRWQQRRAVEKQAMLAAAAQVLDARVPQPLALAADAQRRRAYDWAQGAGQFDPGGPLWLDNQLREGRAGVHVYRVFRPERGAPLLVDLGWLPLPASRALPAVERPRGRVVVRGLLAPPPSPGIALGAGVAPQDNGWLLTRIDTASLGRTIGLDAPLAPRVLRLDPALAWGYPRDLALLANTLTPDKHRGYALQWYALALAVLVTALLLTFRRPRR